MRQLQRILAALVLVAGVAGIATAAKPKPAPAASGPKLRVYTWSKYMVDELVKEFEKAHNVKVEVTTYETNEELMAAMLVSKTPAYDLIFPSAEDVPTLMAAKKLATLDAAKTKNRDNLHPQFRNMWFDPKEESCLPYLWGISGIAYNSKFVSNVDSWSALWDAKNKGKIVLLDEMRDTVGAALIYGGASPNSVKDDELAKAKKLLMDQKPLVASYSSEKAAEMLKNDQAWVSNLWGGDALQLAQTKKEIKYVLPKEGGVMSMDTMCVPAGATGAALAMDFINFLLEPKSGAMLSSKLRFATPNKAALPLVDPKVLADPMIYPSWADMARAEFQRDLGKDLSKWSTIWKEVRK
jgi:spermidine/putrescine transport system substrate-binding protein